MINNDTLSNYMDPCNNCSALCCRVYNIVGTGKFKNILIKILGENCTHLENSSCKIYKNRSELGFGVCEDFSCFGTGALVTDWIKNSGADFSLARIALSKSKAYIGYLLDFDTKVEFESSRTIDHIDGLEHIKYILASSPVDSEESVRKHWDDYIYPKRWYTPAEDLINKKRIHEAQCELLDNL